MIWEAIMSGERPMKPLLTRVVAALCLLFVFSAQRLPAQALDENDDLRDLQDAASREPAIPSCFGDKIRISALIQSSGGVKVGIVETATKASYLVKPGETAGDVEVVSADYDREMVVLKLGSETCTLSLASDPNAPKPVLADGDPNSGLYRGEAIENFLKENPSAIDDGIIKFPLPVMPPAVGKGEGIERFLRLFHRLAGGGFFFDQVGIGIE